MQLFNNRKQKQNELKSLSDEQLVARYARKGDSECVGLLYERYTHLVFAVCMKYCKNEEEAEDLVMIVFEKLFDELRKPGIQNFKNWLFTVARNQCLMHIRHSKSVERRKEEVLLALEEEVMESGKSEHLNEGENGEKSMLLLEKGIESLNEAQRSCIVQFYLGEKSYNEVSDSTGYSLNEVKSHLQNGKRNLKIFLEKALQK